MILDHGWYQWLASLANLLLLGFASRRIVVFELYAVNIDLGFECFYSLE